MAQKVHVVESSSGLLQEQHNHVQDQEEDANYVSSYQGGPNKQRTNYQGGQDHDQCGSVVSGYLDSLVCFRDVEL